MEDSTLSAVFIVLAETADCSSATSMFSVLPETEDPSSTATAFMPTPGTPEAASAVPLSFMYPLKEKGRQGSSLEGRRGRRRRGEHSRALPLPPPRSSGQETSRRSLETGN
jgi:hypothetical protein